VDHTGADKAMSLKWDDIPMAAKMTAAIIPVVAAAVTWLFVTFETADAAQQKWAQHNQAIACRTVYEIEEKIRSYLERLKFDDNLTTSQKDWIKEEIRNLQEKVKRIDPDGQC
jgi:hypothetical protein